jgi:tetratricopeptide (TPR) repeat protein
MSASNLLRTGFCALSPLVLCLLVTAAPATTSAHAPDAQQIEHLDAEIRVHPNDVDLLLRRAGVLQEAGRRQDAARDYQRVLALDPHRVEAHLGQAVMLLDRGNVAAAQQALDQCPKGDAVLEAQRWKIQSEVFRAQHSYVEAARALDHSIRINPTPRPEDYIQRADLAMAAGLPDEAMATLDRGIAQLNGAVALRWRAIDIAIETQLTESALVELDHLEKMMPGSALVSARRGDVFAACGRNLEADAAWTEALARIEATPLSERSPADQSLAKRLRGDLAMENPR